MSKAKRTGKLVSNILAWITGSFVIVLLALQIYGQVTRRTNNDVARYGKYQVFVVLTDSMEPSYKVGTALIVEQITDFSALKPSTTLTSRDGDTITFQKRPGFNITHRLVHIELDENGDYILYLLGDNLNADSCDRIDPDTGKKYCDPERDQDVVRAQNVFGKVVTQSPALGKVYGVLSNSFAILLLGIVPLFFVFLTSIVDLIKELKPARAEHQKQVNEQEALNYELEKIKEEEKLKLYIEIEKEKMRKELEAEGENKDE